jgi:UDP-glucose 4-epimerase
MVNMTYFSIFGAEGFIGRHLKNYLDTRGYDVWAVPRELTDFSNCLLGRTIYCAGVTNDFWSRPFDTVNAHTCSLVPILRDGKFERLIYLSSIRLYDGLVGLVDEGSTLHLNPQTPRHLFDLSKGLGEALAHSSGRPIAVVRLATVYDNRLAEDNFLCRTVHQAIARNELTLHADPEDGRDYIHINDVCVALEAIALDAHCPAYNLATGSILTNAHLAALCEHELGCLIKFEVPAARRTLPPAIDISRLSHDFSLYPASPRSYLPSIIRSLRRGTQT